ncbi:MAG: hypothetical protein ABI867_06405 [Kofleriaceae bacterium]
MRLFRSIIITSLFLLPTFVACGGDDDGGDEEPFDTFQECFDDHHIEEAADVITSIKICCIDHPIGGEEPDVVCGESAADCADFVDNELDTASATADEITTACDEYIIERAE